jgi:hypothetical protein
VDHDPPGRRAVSIVEALVLVEVKYHQHFHRAQEPWSPVVPDRVRGRNVATRSSWVYPLAHAEAEAAGFGSGGWSARGQGG